MKGKQVTLAHAQQLFAQERETVLVSVMAGTRDTSPGVRRFATHLPGVLCRVRFMMQLI